MLCLDLLAGILHSSICLGVDVIVDDICSGCCCSGCWVAETVLWCVANNCCYFMFLLLGIGFVWLVLKVWTGMLGNIKYVFGPRYSIVIEATLMNIALGFYTAYTQTYKEN